MKNWGKDEFVYQGVITDKENIKQDFYKMKNSIEKDGLTFVLEDWDSMKVLLDSIVFAFRY